MQLNDMVKYRDKIGIYGTFLSKHLKKSVYDYVLENVNDLIQKIKSMSENINPSLFNEFFELSPADYAK